MIKLKKQNYNNIAKFHREAVLWLKRTQGIYEEQLFAISIFSLGLCMLHVFYSMKFPYCVLIMSLFIKCICILFFYSCFSFASWWKASAGIEWCPAEAVVWSDYSTSSIWFQLRSTLQADSDSKLNLSKLKSKLNISNHKAAKVLCTILQLYFPGSHLL